MEIYQTITTMAERTILFRHNGKQGSLTRPACVSFEEMEKEIRNKLAAKDPTLAADPPVSEPPKPVEAVDETLSEPVAEVQLAKKRKPRKA